MIGLAVLSEQERNDREALVVKRFDDKAVQTADLFDALILIAERSGKKVQTHLTPQAASGLDFFLSKLSPVPGFRAEITDTKGKLLAGTPTDCSGCVAASATIQPIDWHVRIAQPRATLFQSVGSNWIVWVTLALLLVSTMLRTELLRAIRSKNELLEMTESELKRKNLDLDAFASAAAHDIRGPLRRINSFMQILRDEEELPPRALDYVKRSAKQAARLDQLIEDLATYARSGEESELTEQDLNRLVDEVRVSMSLEIAQTGARIVVMPLPCVIGNSDDLKRVFANLIINSMKFVEKGQTPFIEISSGTADGMAEIAVRDHGIGVEPNYRERIFEPFKRLHTQDEYEGTGLGLASVKRIIQHHGGTIRCTGTNNGPGTIITFTLPLAGKAKNNGSPR
jgi:signal transduction histidine kinase